MSQGKTPLLEARVGSLRVARRPDFPAELVVQAIELHRANAEKGREHCEHWGPGSSVSHVLLQGDVDFDLAVKWNHSRGLRGALSDAWAGSRAARAVAGADVLAGLGLGHPETLAFAERRGAGLPFESFLITRFASDAQPLPVEMAGLCDAEERRRALASEVGTCIGTLHAAGYDHGDLKHSNLLVRRDGRVLLLDLDSLVPPTEPTWRRVVRSLGQLEAYTRDLYPWVLASDRAAFLRAYFAQRPELRSRRADLLTEVEAWVERRLASWEGRDRELHIYYPLAPRETRPCTVATVRGTRVRRVEGA